MALTGAQKALLQSRSGLEQCGATRCGFYHPRPIITVGGVDVTRYVDLTTLEATSRLNSDPDEAHFTVRALRVLEGQRVTIANGADQTSLRDFSGYVVRTSQDIVEGHVLTTVDCVDSTRILDKRRITARFANVSATAIVLAIAAGATEITAKHVEGSLPNIDLIVFENELRSIALTRVAKQITPAAYWFLDNSDTPDLYFFRTLTNEAQPPDITNASMPGYIESLSIDGDITQIRTRVVGEGKSTQTPLGTPAGAETIVVDASASVDYLVVAGGGAGAGLLAGGGGGGGVQQGTDLISSGAYAVVVGAGGTAGNNGADSSWNLHTATGGGKGGSSAGAGGNGGSGGGGGAGTSPGSGLYLQGYNGGAGTPYLQGAGGGGGGGGAQGSAAYLVIDGSVGGNGGAGVISYITGASVAYAGGGGGNGAAGSGTGGSGGGGTGGAGGNPSTAGTANTGGGGGGGESRSGGSGIVILSYVTGALSATGGTITTAAGRTIHTFIADGTFTVSDVVYSAPVTPIEDIPIEDASQLDPEPGTVRIGTHIIDYSALSGPATGGENPPGTTLSADAALLATTLSVVDETVFATSPGWVKVGDQIVRYTGTSAGTLTGIPSVGYGSLKAAVEASTPVTWLPSLVLTTPQTFDPPIEPNQAVIQRVTVDDTVAQAAQAAIEGGDGIYEFVFSNDRLSLAGLTAQAQAELDVFGGAIRGLRYTTRHPAHRTGRQVTAVLTGRAGTLDGTFTIQEVRVKGYDQVTRYDRGDRTGFPVREVTATPLRIQQLVNLIGEGA